MNYELAKELYDAGYPQKGTYIQCQHGVMKDRNCADHKFPYEYGKDGIVIVPTVDELILACGPNFRELKQVKGKWEAHSFRTYPENVVHGIKGGPSPIAVIAKLWLALNKK